MRTMAPLLAGSSPRLRTAAVMTYQV